MQCVVGPNTLAATLQHQPQPPKDSPPAAAAACLAAAPAAAACHAFTTCAAWLRPVLLLACAGGVLCSAPRMAQLPGASWSSSDPYTLITHPGVVQGDALPMWQASSSQPPTQGHPARYVAASKPRSSVSRHYCSMAAIWGPGMEPLPHKPTHGDQGWATGWQGMAVWCVCVVWSQVGCLPRSANPRAFANPHVWSVAQLLVKHWSNQGNKNGSSWCGTHSRAVKQGQSRAPLHTHSAAGAPQAALVLMAC